MTEIEKLFKECDEKAIKAVEEIIAENERLKGEVRKWKRDSAITSAMFRLVVQGKECTSTKVLEDAERVENLEKENAKLKVENKRLKAENIMLRSAGLKQTLEHEQIFKDFIKENAKLKRELQQSATKCNKLKCELQQSATNCNKLKEGK